VGAAKGVGKQGKGFMKRHILRNITGLQLNGGIEPRGPPKKERREAGGGERRRPEKLGLGGFGEGQSKKQ